MASQHANYTLRGTPGGSKPGPLRSNRAATGWRASCFGKYITREHPDNDSDQPFHKLPKSHKQIFIRTDASAMLALRSSRLMPAPLAMIVSSLVLQPAMQRDHLTAAIAAVCCTTRTLPTREPGALIAVANAIRDLLGCLFLDHVAQSIQRTVDLAFRSAPQVPRLRPRAFRSPLLSFYASRRAAASGAIARGNNTSFSAWTCRCVSVSSCSSPFSIAR